MKYNTKNYDYLVVGSGLFGAIFAHEAAKFGKKSLVIDKRDHIGGNMYTYKQNGINVHKYGAHIFHTDDKDVWNYINKFAEFNNFQNQVVANYKGELYNLPFNMNTFYQMWGVKTPEEAKKKIEEQRNESLGLIDGEPKNLEEQAISLIGTDIYQKLIKGYTEKQWGKKATELPAFIIKRLPVRFKFDNNYFNHRYQGIPIGGYTQIFDKLFDNKLIDIKLDCDFKKDKEIFLNEFKNIVYTGPIDEFFNYEKGQLEYRSLKFEHETLQRDNYQGNAVINYTDFETPYTRSMEWKHFDGESDANVTVITREYPQDWSLGEEAYYPVNDDKNNKKYKEYAKLTESISNNHVIFGGRLGQYRYYDMDQVVNAVFNTLRTEFELDKNYKF